MSARSVYTIGYAGFTAERFLARLEQYQVTVLCDVRSSPYSRISREFDREALKTYLKSRGIAYLFLGKELGARSEDPRCYHRGKVDYTLLAKTRVFLSGIERIKKGAQFHTIAIMCAEKDPLSCHRSILIARALTDVGLNVGHILDNGTIENHKNAECRLLRLLGLPEQDLFKTRDELIREAYEIQGHKIAYEPKKGLEQGD